MEINASKQQTPQQNQILGPAWRGLGFWNFYFLGKFALYLTGYINFDLFYNALFFAALVFPLRPLWLHRLRQYLAIPIGIAVLYHDTWFPPFSRLLAQPEVLHFSSHYLLELIGRFINWNLLGAGFIFLVVYLFLAQWFRLTLFTVLGLLIIALSTTPQIGLPGLQWQSIATINADKNAMSAVANTTTTAAQANHGQQDRKSTRLNSSHVAISYAVFCLK